MAEEPDHRANLALVTALLAHLTREAGIDALVIKGLATEHHGLRPPRISGDVDLLVRPREVARCIALLAEHGWHPAGPRLPKHAAAFIHPQWSCSLDLHEYFPGLLVEPDDAFDQLWAERTEAHIAHQRVACPGYLGTTMVQAVNALRTPGPRDDDLEFLIQHWSNESATALEQLTAFAAELAATATAGPFFSALGAVVEPTGTDRAGWLEWQLRMEVADHPGIMWFHMLSQLPVRRWPLMLRHAARLDDNSMQGYARSHLGGAQPLWRARLKRLGRKLPVLPRTAWTYAQVRRRHGK